MKKIILLIAMFIISNLYSQVPNNFTWQGILTDSQGINLNGSYSLRFSIFNTETGGNSLWTELRNNVIIENGYVSLSLGDSVPLNLNFNEQYWLEITVGSNNPLPRAKINSVPYSLYSKRCPTIIQGDSIVLKNDIGETKIVLNPNTGTIKMLSKDTVWYSLSVNSPVEKREYYEDGTSYIQTGNIGKYYNKENVLEEELITEGEYGPGGWHRKFYQDGSIAQETIVINDKDEKKSTRVEIEYDFYGNIVSKVERIDSSNFVIYNVYDSNNVLISQRIVDIKTGKESVRKASNTSEGFNINKSSNSVSFGTNYDSEGSPALQIAPNNTNTGYIIGYAADNTYSSRSEYLQGTININPGTGGNTYIESNATVRGSLNTVGSLSVNGGINTSGTVTANGLQVTGPKNFAIDHPFDNSRLLLHASIESNEVLNKYSGNIITDNDGEAIVILPPYFEAINIDFRYQLTVIGTFSQAIVLEKIKNNKFVIKTDKPNVEVSWEVTAKRNDKYMIEHPFNPEVQK